METNTLYYTFSTIAQALGGVIGLLAAVALYRLQSLDRSMAESSLVAIQYGEIASQHLWDLRARADFTGLVSELDRRLAEKYPPPAQLPYRAGDQVAMVNSLRTDAKWHERLRTTLWHTVVATVIAIGVSTLLIPAAPWLLCHKWFAYPAIALALGLCGYCLSRFVVLTLVVVQPTGWKATPT